MTSGGTDTVASPPAAVVSQGELSPPLIRETEIAQAARFLGDPRVKSSSLESKEIFLRNKGLTDTEIRHAMSLGKTVTQPDNFGSMPFPGVDNGSSFWGFIATVGSFAAAMAAGAFVYDLWLQKMEERKNGDIRRLEITEHQRTHTERASSSQSQASEEKLAELIKTLKEGANRQEQRYSEQTRMLKDLAAAVADIQNDRVGLRKVGGSVVVSRAPSTNDTPNETFGSAMTQEEQLLSLEESQGLPEGSLQVATQAEPPATTGSLSPSVISSMATELRGHISRPTVIMILQNLTSNFEDERFRRINLSSARFKEKIGLGLPLEILKAAGFVLDGNALIFPKDGDHAQVADVLRVVEGFVESE